jgi:hypothetical protein
MLIPDLSARHSSYMLNDTTIRAKNVNAPGVKTKADDITESQLLILAILKHNRPNACFNMDQEGISARSGNRRIFMTGANYFST